MLVAVAVALLVFVVLAALGVLVLRPVLDFCNRRRVHTLLDEAGRRGGAQEVEAMGNAVRAATTHPLSPTGTLRASHRDTSVELNRTPAVADTDQA